MGGSSCLSWNWSIHTGSRGRGWRGPVDSVASTTCSAFIPYCTITYHLKISSVFYWYYMITSTTQILCQHHTVVPHPSIPGRELSSYSQLSVHQGCLPNGRTCPTRYVTHALSKTRPSRPLSRTRGYPGKSARFHCPRGERVGRPRGSSVGAQSSSLSVVV